MSEPGSDTIPANSDPAPLWYVPPHSHSTSLYASNILWSGPSPDTSSLFPFHSSFYFIICSSSFSYVPLHSHISLHSRISLCSHFPCSMFPLFSNPVTNVTPTGVRTCHKGRNEKPSPAGRLTTCLLHIGRTSDWHGCKVLGEFFESLW